MIRIQNDHDPDKKHLDHYLFDIIQSKNIAKLAELINLKYRTYLN